MWKRWLSYFAVAIIAIPVFLWLAFALGIGPPLLIFIWPVEKILWYLNPGAGSAPSWDLGGTVVLSAAFWLCVAITVDVAVLVVRRARAV